MSLWLQAATEALEEGEYQRLRVDILPVAPIPVPGCLLRELEFAERHCQDLEKDPLFPIRFLWLMEAHEQCMSGLSPLGRSFVHPETLLKFWEDASADVHYRQEGEAAGFRFDFAEKAMELGTGWIYIGERFVEDFLEIETALGVELLFPDPSSSEGRPAFRESKRQHANAESSAEPAPSTDDPSPARGPAGAPTPNVMLLRQRQKRRRGWLRRLFVVPVPTASLNETPEILGYVVDGQGRHIPVHRGHIRHESLSDDQLRRIGQLHDVLSEAYPMTLDGWIDGFMRDAHPESEMQIMEACAVVYLRLAAQAALSPEEKKRLFGALCALSRGNENPDVASVLPADRGLPPLDAIVGMYQEAAQSRSQP